MPPSTRDRIVHAATGEFARRGPIEATLEEIREQAGVSVGSLYHHFSGKEALHAEAWLTALAGYQAGALEVLAEHTSAEDGIKALVRHHLRWVEQAPDDARLLLGARPTGPASEPLTERNREFFSRVRAWYATHATYGAVRPLGFAVLYAVWLGPAQEYARHHLGTPIPVKDIRELAQAAWRALRAEEQT